MRMSDEDAVLVFGLMVGLVCVAAFALVAGGAEGAHTEVVNATDEVFVGLANYGYANNMVTHTLDDHVVIPYVNSDGDLMVYVQASGDPEEHYEVAATGALGTTGPWYAVGAVSTSNGSVCVGATALVGSYRNEIWLFSHFLGKDWDDWDDELIDDAGYHKYPAMAINDTDIICFFAKDGPSSPYSSYWGTFDFEAYAMDQTYTSWGLNILGVIGLQANESGNFIVAYRGNDNNNYYRPVDKSHIAIQISTSSLVFGAFGILNNDMCVLAGGASTGHRYYSFQESHEGAFTHRIITDDATTWSYGATLSVMGNSTNVTVLSYNEDDDTIWKFHYDWNGDATGWQNSKVDLGISATNFYRMNYGGTNNQRWPRTETGAWFADTKVGYSVVIMHDTGAAEDEIIWLSSNDLEYWGDFTQPAPNITTAALPDGVYNVAYSHTLTYTGGTPPRNWTILVGPVWLSMGALNWTLYGTPTAVGDFTVTVRLLDAVERSDIETWTLHVDSAPSEGGGDPTFGGTTWATWWGPTCLSGAFLAAVVVLVFVWGAFQVATRR